MNDFFFKCPNCLENLESTIRHGAINSKMRWSLSFHCSKCGFSQEEDGIGWLPTRLREIILEKEGEFSILFDSKQLASIKILKEQLGLANNEVLEFFKKEPYMVKIGTQEEAKFIFSLISKIQNDIKIVRISK